MNHINVIGAGLAGCEAAHFIAKHKIKVRLYEMKPHKYSPAHQSKNFAELVCSNSFRAASPLNAVGLLKEEMSICGSIVMEAANHTKVPAGGAFAVDRNKFSDYITKKISENPFIEIVNIEMDNIPDNEITVIATGPLTSEKMSVAISGVVGEYLYFFDAAAPIVEADSINMESAFNASRYGKGGNDYINCPLTEEEYKIFYHEMINANTSEPHGFEDNRIFEGCMPVEVMAKRGYSTLLYGPMKPVGIIDPTTEKQPFAVVQLRQDNAEKTMYNIVGFQTRLTFGEQKRVFSLIPALRDAVFLRYGVMHKNTFINSPKLLDVTYRMKNHENIFFAGQITGVEGYVESASSGIIAGINAAHALLNIEPLIFPRYTAAGALAHYISGQSIENFQPMNINYGIIEYPTEKIKGGKKAVKEHIYTRSAEYFRNLNYNFKK